MVCQKAAPIWLPYTPNTVSLHTESGPLRRLEVTYALAGLEVDLKQAKRHGQQQFIVEISPITTCWERRESGRDA